MERHGFIHDNLEIKVLILYILRKLPDFIDGDALLELALCDDGISYFDYVQCLSELVESKQIEQDGKMYKVTERGAENGSTIESSLPYSVRKKLDKTVSVVEKKMRRDALILSTHEPAVEGGYMVSLGLSDGVGDLISLKILAGDETQAELIKKNFRANAEVYYNKIIDILSE